MVDFEAKLLVSEIHQKHCAGYKQSSYVLSHIKEMDSEEDDEDWEYVKKKQTLDRNYTNTLIKARRMLRYLSFTRERQTLVSLKTLPKIQRLIKN